MPKNEWENQAYLNLIEQYWQSLVKLLFSSFRKPGLCVSRLHFFLIEYHGICLYSISTFEWFMHESCIAGKWIVGSCIVKYTLFYKQYFYKQDQAEIGTKVSISYATHWACIFAIWKIFTFFIRIIIQTS